MRRFEQILVDLDSGASGAMSRVALGLAIVPAFRLLTGNSERIWLYAILFLGLLFALRMIPAVLRHVLPFSSEPKAIWVQRRQIAKQHDSYQWQKLFWIGLGLLPYAFLGNGQRLNEIILTLFCLIGGSAGIFLWRRNKDAHGSALQPAAA